MSVLPSEKIEYFYIFINFVIGFIFCDDIILSQKIEILLFKIEILLFFNIFCDGITLSQKIKNLIFFILFATAPHRRKNSNFFLKKRLLATVFFAVSNNIFSDGKIGSSQKSQEISNVISDCTVPSQKVKNAVAKH